MMFIKKAISNFKKKTTIGRLVLFMVSLSGIFNNSFAQQNIQFTQYLFNTLSVNPAYAGYKEDWYAQVAHRMQWIGINDAPETTQISVDGLTNFLTKNIGLGLQMTSDKLGAQSANSLYANYAYRIQLDNTDMSRLSFGLGVGVTQYGTDVSKLQPVSANDPVLTTGIDNVYIPDVRFGIYYYNPTFFIGLSAIDLFSAKKAGSIYSWNTDSTVNIVRQCHYYIISGGLLGLTDYTKIRPSIMIREDLKGPTNLDLSATFIFDNRFWVGASYRTAVQLWKKDYSKGQSLNNVNAISGNFQFQVNERFRVGYSYDFALNGLSTYQKGTHELTLGVLLTRNFKRVLSPRFF